MEHAHFGEAGIGFHVFFYLLTIDQPKKPGCLIQRARKNSTGLREELQPQEIAVVKLTCEGTIKIISRTLKIINNASSPLHPALDCVNTHVSHSVIFDLGNSQAILA